MLLINDKTKTLVSLVEGDPSKPWGYRWPTVSVLYEIFDSLIDHFLQGNKEASIFLESQGFLSSGVSSMAQHLIASWYQLSFIYLKVCMWFWDLSLPDVHPWSPDRRTKPGSRFNNDSHQIVEPFLDPLLSWANWRTACSLIIRTVVVCFNFFFFR